MMKIHLTGSGKNNRISKPLLYSLLGILVGIGIILIFLNKESIWFLSEAGDKPVAHWKFDEGQGSTAYDSMASYHGALGTGSSSPTWVTEDMCVSEKCLRFDGSNDYVDIGVASNSVKTLSFWVRASSATEYMIDLNGSSYVSMSDGALNATGFSSPSIFVDGIESDSISPNAWHHVAIITDTGINASDFELGRLEGTGYLNGFIDELKVYDYSRTADQIRADYNARGGSRGTNAQFGYPSDQSGTNLSQGLVGYWKMDETSGDISDSSGNGMTLTNNGNATFVPGKFAYGSEYVPASTQYFSTASTISGVKSVSFWVNPDSTTNYYISLNAGAYITSSSGTISTTGFTNPKIYVNGSLSSTISADVWSFVTVTTETSLDASQYYVGRQGSNYFDGTLDEVRIYNRALSDSEVRALYNWAPGPVAHWDFNENTGSSAQDISGNGYNASWVGSASWKTGKYGSSVSSNSYTNYLSVSDSADLRLLSTSFTISGWIYLNSYTLATWASPIITKRPLSTYDGWDLMVRGEYDGSNKRKLCSFIGSGTIRCSTNTIPLGVWKKIDMVYEYVSAGNTNTIKYYIDGVLDNTLTSIGYVGSNTGTNTRFFSNYDNYSEFQIDAQLDEFKIYNYARTPAQIVEDMNAGHPAPGSPVGSAVSYYKFDEGYGTTANDSSSNANNLTLSSASWTNSGKIGKAWNGTDASWMSRADDPDFDFDATDPLSISFWFKSDSASNPGATEYVVNKSNATTAGYAVYANTSGNICFAIDDDATWSPDVSACTATDVYDGTWHHVVATRDITADTIHIFLDGELKDSNTDSTTATLENALSFYVGDRDGVDNGDEFAGDIDELKIYRFALNKEQVIIEFSQGKSQVLGSLSTESDGKTPSHASDRAPCVPGDTSNCTSPVGTYAFDETTGSTAYNKGSGGASNDGAITQAVLGKKGKVNTAFQFDGVDDRVIVSSSQLIKNSASGGAICTWVYPTNADSTDDIIYSEDALGGTHLHLRRNGTGNKFEFGINDSVGTWRWATSPSSHVANRWYYVCGTFSLSPNLVNLYVDGAQVAQNTSWNGTFQNTQAVINVLIGDMTNAGNWGWGGFIDEVRIYNYTRTPAQIAWEYNKGAPIAWYKMDECSGTAIYNSAKNGNGDAAGNNGTLTIGGSGSNTSVGTCATSGAWYDAATGKINSAMDFDGTDDYVTVSGTIPANSVALWVKPTTNSASLVQLTSGAYVSASSGVISATGFTSPTYYVNGALTTSPILTANVWNHIVITTTTSLTANMISFGMANGAYTSGQIDEVKIFNYPLSSAQVKDVYNGGAVSFR